MVQRFNLGPGSVEQSLSLKISIGCSQEQTPGSGPPVCNSDTMYIKWCLDRVHILARFAKKRASYKLPLIGIQSPSS